MSQLKTSFGLTAAVLAGLLSMHPAMAQDANDSAAAAYQDMQLTLGIVPGFFKQFPEVGIAGAWAEFKTVQLNPNTALTGKEKELIGLAVASQIPCTYCIYFHTAAAKANGATDERCERRWPWPPSAAIGAQC